MTTAATISARLTLDQSDFSKGITAAEKSANSFANRMKNIGSGMSNAGRTMTFGLTLPIVAAGGAMTKFANDLDTQMKNIQSISMQTDEEIAQMRQTFLDWSADGTTTRDTAAELAEGFFFIQSSGFAGAEGMTVLDAATRAASAGLTDTMTAGNAILAVLNAYGLEAKDAEHVSDVLFKTVDLGVTTFEDLATQLGDIVSTTATLDVSLEEVGAAISLLTRKGIQTPEAMTAINQLLLQFISPSAKMKKAAKALGVEWEDLQKTLREDGLKAALDMMVAAGGDDALLSIFGDNVRALKGALGLASGGTEDFGEMIDQFQDVGGRTREAFDVQMQSNVAKWEVFVNKVTKLGMKLADVFVPVLLELIDAITPFVDKLAEADPALLKWGVAITAIVAIAGPLLMFIGGLVTAIGAIGAAIAAISAPVLLIGAAILLLIGWIILLYIAWKNNFLGIQDRLNAFIAWFKPIWDTIWTAALAVFNYFKIQFQTLMEAFKAAAAGDWYTFGEKLREIWDRGWGLIKAAAEMAWNTLLLGLKTWISTVIDTFTNTNWIEVGKNILMGIVNGLESMRQWAINTIISIGTAMVDAFRGFFGINSPSTLMAEQFKYLAEGAMMGWNQSFMFSPQAISQQIVPSSIHTSGQQDAGGANAKEQTININIENPKKETSEESVRKTLKSLSYTGVLS